MSSGRWVFWEKIDVESTSGSDIAAGDRRRFCIVAGREFGNDEPVDFSSMTRETKPFFRVQTAAFNCVE